MIARFLEVSLCEGNQFEGVRDELQRQRITKRYDR